MRVAMPTHWGVWILVLLAAACSIACGREDQSDAFGMGEPPALPKFGDDALFDEAADALRSATDVTLYEGLPHHTRERDLLESELASKSVVRSHDWPFYATPMPLESAEKDALRIAFSNPGNFCARDPNAYKLCGGFHPDYELRWSGPAGNYEMQFCFGCGEVNLYTPSGMAGFDMIGGYREDSTSPYRELLFTRRAQRPAPPA